MKHHHDSESLSSMPRTLATDRFLAGALAPWRRFMAPWCVTILLHLTIGLTIGGFAPAAALAAEPDASSAAAAFAEFARDDSPRIRAKLDVSDREYRQIEPTLWHLSRRHADALAGLSPKQRLDTLVALAGFIERQRDKHADDVVLADGRHVIGLLDPDRGLEPKEVTAIAGAYGAEATVWKQGAGGPTGPDTKAATAEGFLEVVHDAARSGEPTTIVVLGHGLPTEIQSYSIPCDRLAAALLGGAATRDPVAGEGGPRIDLGHLVLVCDDCFSADFLENLGAAIEQGAERRGCRIAALPACIAGTNRDRYGIADFGEKFVPHFWKTCIELYYIRKPLPESILLADLFEAVDNMMYGYGRTPVVEDGKVTGYRLVNADLVQDPVVFVSLDDDDLAELRTILGLPADAPLPRLFDLG
jgi:hypothetical protein